MKRLLKESALRHKGLFLTDLISALFVSLIDLSFPVVVRRCVYEYMPNSMWTVFFITSGLMLAFYILRSLAIYNMWYYGHSFGARVENDLRINLFGHVQGLGYSFFTNNRTGQILSRLTTDLFDVTEMSHHAPEDVLVSALTISGAIAVMFTIQWKLTLFIALSLPLFLLLVLRNKKEMKRTSNEVKKKTARINTEFEQAIRALRLAEAEGSESAEMRKFISASESYKSSKYDFYKAMGIFNSSMEMLLCFLPLAILTIGGILIMSDGMSVLDMITFNLYIASFVSPLRKLANTIEIVANGTAGLRRMKTVLDTKPSVTDKPDAVELKSAKGGIEFKNVVFSYDGNRKEDPTLKGISFRVRPGETVALCGESGGGKTTIANLCMRFYDPDSGSILIDDMDIKDITQKSLRRNIGLISQDIFLFADSILENVRYSKPQASDEEVLKAIEMAELADDVGKMRDGVHAQAGENGALLSGGQRQRIAIARTFLKNPPILILDEATSALDSITEAKIQKTFDRLSKDRTTIIIAHRLSTVRNADKIIVISDGRISESGAPSELLAKPGGKYRAMALGEKA